MSFLTRLVAIALIVSVPGLACAQRTFGLVIGINNYRYVPTLDGARADAMDVSQALAKGGVEHVVTLIDDQANKASITRAWQTLLGASQSGDVIFISYAGHGAQAPQRTAGEEKDGTDEFWVLPGFDPKRVRETWRETIFDNELYQWYEDAARKGVRVVLVSDSCHAGGMDRAVRGRLRFVDVGKSRLLGELIALMANDNQSAPVEQAMLPGNVTLLAATPESLPVPEVVIDGKPRGALSWSVARAIEGMADRDQDGVITRNELEDYVLASVRMRSEALQTPVFAPFAARSTDEMMMAVRRNEPVRVAAESAGQSANRPMPMARDLGFKPVLPVVVKGSAVTPEDTVSGGAFAYEWDATKGIFKTPNGEVAAEQISTYTVNEVVSKFILLDFLKTLASRNAGSIAIAPQKSLYFAGERIKFDTSRGKYRNMLVFNLANTGEVQFLDMITNGEPSGKAFLKEMRVVAPFGADHLVTIASDQPLEAIGRAMERGATPKEILQALSSRIDGTDTAIAIVPIYTRNN